MLLSTPAVCTRRSMPCRAMKSWKPNEAEITPIEPTMLFGSTWMRSAAVASQ